MCRASRRGFTPELLGWNGYGQASALQGTGICRDAAPGASVSREGSGLQPRRELLPLGCKPEVCQAAPTAAFRGRMRSKAVVPDFSAPGSRSKEDTFSKDMGVGSGFRMIHTCIAFTLPISSMTVTSAPPQIRHSIPKFGDPQLRAWARLSVLWANNKGFLCFCWLWGHQQKDLSWGQNLEGQ